MPIPARFLESDPSSEARAFGSTALTGTAGDEAILWEWTYTPAVTGYEVHWGLTTGGPYPNVEDVLVSGLGDPTAPEWTQDRTGGNGVEVFAVVRPFVQVGLVRTYGPYSNEASATPVSPFTPAHLVRFASASGGSVRIYDADGALLTTHGAVGGSVGDLDVDGSTLYIARDTSGVGAHRTVNLLTGSAAALADTGQGVAVDHAANGAAGYLWSGVSNSTLKRWNLGMTAGSNVGTNEFDVRWITTDRVNTRVIVGRTQASSTFRGLWQYPGYGAPETGTRLVNTSTIRDVQRDADGLGACWAINATNLYKVVNGALAATIAYPTTGYLATHQILVDSASGYSYHYAQESGGAFVLDRYDFDGSAWTNKVQLLTGLVSGTSDRFILWPQ